MRTTRAFVVAFESLARSPRARAGTQPSRSTRRATRCDSRRACAGSRGRLRANRSAPCSKSSSRAAHSDSRSSRWPDVLLNRPLAVDARGQHGSASRSRTRSSSRAGVPRRRSTMFGNAHGSRSNAKRRENQRVRSTMTLPDAEAECPLPAHALAQPGHVRDVVRPMPRVQREHLIEASDGPSPGERVAARSRTAFIARRIATHRS